MTGDAIACGRKVCTSRNQHSVAECQYAEYPP